MTETISNFQIGQAMEKYGGSFIKGLGQALQHSDEQNAAKIKAAWPDHWREYEIIAERDEDKPASECAEPPLSSLLVAQARRFMESNQWPWTPPSQTPTESTTRHISDK